MSARLEAGQTLIEPSEDIRSLAKNRVYLDEFGMGRNQLADVGPIDGQRGERRVVSIKGKHAGSDVAQCFAVNRGKVCLRIEVDE